MTVASLKRVADWLIAHALASPPRAGHSDFKACGTETAETRGSRNAPGQCAPTAESPLSQDPPGKPQR